MDYDGPWKEAVEDLFEDFLLFFFPHIHNVRLQLSYF
jgi:hypothetical protein